MNTHITEPARQLPVIAQYDVAVVGGGVAGIAAALAAARHGASVLLVERSYMLGGLATAGLIAIYLPLCDGHGRQVSFGIAEELLRLSVRHGLEGPSCDEWLVGGTVDQRKKRRFEVQYNPAVFAIEAEQVLKEAGVSFLYGSAVCAARTEGGRITHLIVENKSGRSAIACGRVIDATGDADVCLLSGEKTVEFTRGNRPAYWYYATENGANRLKTVGSCDDPKNLQPDAPILTDDPDRYWGCDAQTLTDLTLRCHRSLLEHFLRSGPVSPQHSLSTIATTPQIRMSRRLDGVSTPDETAVHREFADSVGLFSDWRKPGPVYELPFSCMRGTRVVNLLAVGRCLSVTDALWDVTRVIPVCAVSGQAAGTAAALADDFSAIDIAALQKALGHDGVVLHESALPN